MYKLKILLSTLTWIETDVSDPSALDKLRAGIERQRSRWWCIGKHQTWKISGKPQDIVFCLSHVVAASISKIEP